MHSSLQQPLRFAAGALLTLGTLTALTTATISNAGTTKSNTTVPGAASGAGLKQYSFDYHGTTVPVALWFPANGTSEVTNAGPFDLRTIPAATIATKKHPLLLISHGTGGSNIAHHPIAATLAGAGYLVAAIEHPGDNFRDRSMVTSTRYFDERPRQFVAMLDALLVDNELHDRIDLNRIGAIGHSSGGYTVLAAVGATASRQQLITHCQNNDDDPSCGYRDPNRGVSSPSENQYQLPPAGAATDALADRRIRSVALLAPLGKIVLRGPLTDGQPAIRIIGAELDAILPHRYHTDHLSKLMPGAVVSIAPGAGHFSFIAPVNQKWKQQLGEVAIDPPGFNRTIFNNQTSRQLAHWFSTTLPVVER